VTAMHYNFVVGPQHNNTSELVALKCPYWKLKMLIRIDLYARSAL
jgi:hypothetical protein